MLQQLVINLFVYVPLSESFEVAEIICVLELFFFDISQSASSVGWAIKVFVNLN